MHTEELRQYLSNVFDTQFAALCKAVQILENAEKARVEFEEVDEAWMILGSVAMEMNFEKSTINYIVGQLEQVEKWESEQNEKICKLEEKIEDLEAEAERCVGYSDIGTRCDDEGYYGLPGRMVCAAHREN